ncbi:TPA: hypothetical protein DCX16_03515 [bacterium]|nr:hypothetical protein [bacterium]
MIDFKFVSHAFRKNIVLSNINLHFDQGELVTIFGPSSSGKTTLLKLIHGFFPPSSGQLIVLGRNMNNISSSSLSAIRRKIGLVMDEFGFLEDRTLEENLEAILSYLPKYERKVRIDYILNVVELTPKRKEKVNFLSGSQRKQFALARAVIIDPAVVLFDEGLVGLDRKKEELFIDILNKVNENGSLVIITSSTQEKPSLFPRRREIVLREGRIEE